MNLLYDKNLNFSSQIVQYKIDRIMNRALTNRSKRLSSTIQTPKQTNIISTIDLDPPHWPPDHRLSATVIPQSQHRVMIDVARFALAKTRFLSADIDDDDPVDWWHESLDIRDISNLSWLGDVWGRKARQRVIFHDWRFPNRNGNAIRAECKWFFGMSRISNLCFWMDCVWNFYVLGGRKCDGCMDVVYGISIEVVSM